MDKTIRRTPDGKPERRTPDEMLRDAVSDDTDIPGKGKPLDLKAYFRPDAEHRMAGKILRDNNVLPAHLQERKDAEEHLKKAEEHLRHTTEKIAPLQKAIRPLAQTLIRTFSDDKEMCKALGLNALPEKFHPNSETPPASDLLETISTFDQLCKQYNARVRDLTYRYLENLRLAHENIEASKKRQLVNRSLLPAYAPIARVDIEAQKEYIQKRFPPPARTPARLATASQNLATLSKAIPLESSVQICLIFFFCLSAKNAQMNWPGKRPVVHRSFAFFSADTST